MNPHDPAPGPTSPSARQPPLLPSALPRDSAFGRSSTERHPAAVEAATAAAITHATDHLREGGIGESFEEEEGGEDGGVSSRPAFAPFFTLVEDARTATATHPAVRYIFSDDDSGVLTETLLRLNAHPASTGGGAAASDRTIVGVAPSSARRSGSDAGAAARAATTTAQSGTTERAIVVTLGADGRSVVAAHSLRPDWQVLGAEVAAAPTLEGEEGETGGLMLRIQGTAGGFRADWQHQHPDSSSSAVGPVAPLDGSLEAAVDRYRERMDELRRVVEAGAPKPATAAAQWS